MESDASYPRLTAEEGERLKAPERDDEHRNACGMEVICEAAQRSTVRFMPVEL